MKITEEYAMHIARDAYFWGWPLVNVYNKRLAAAKSTQLAYAGPVPSAPLNRLVMLTDYVAANERIVACPNQDVAYGGGSVGLELTRTTPNKISFATALAGMLAFTIASNNFVLLTFLFATVLFLGSLANSQP